MQQQKREVSFKKCLNKKGYVNNEMGKLEALKASVLYVHVSSRVTAANMRLFLAAAVLLLALATNAGEFNEPHN